MKPYDIKESNQPLVKKQTHKAKHLTLRKMNMAKRPHIEKTVIMGDISGSMNGQKLRSLQQALLSVWSPGLEEVVFNDSAYAITEQDIGLLRADGETGMLNALEIVWNEEYNHIILATDGDPTDGTREEILLIVEEYHTETPIDTIGISAHGTRDYNPDFLRRLAELTGGRFTDCGDPIMLTQVVQNLLEYKPDKLIGNATKGGVIEL